MTLLSPPRHHLEPVGSLRAADGDDLSVTEGRERCCTVRVAALSAGSVTATTLAFGGSVLLVATAAALILFSVVVAKLLI